ncbi:MFS transporter [Bacillus suaedae]|uniref:MFS transporter n=1 Tax=Halalkalibacter suaedae TaxID=2822140 RepID=A0A941AU34_9BACI|nr:MFS transporter [Bacillus suaedae]MBP3953594.1 MFS transporter [Bacillus suaedae]
MKPFSNLRDYNSTFITFLLFWSGLVILISMYIAISIPDAFSSTYQISTTQTAWISSSFSLAYALGCFFFGPVSDRYGRRVFLVSSIIGLTILTIITGFVTNYIALLVLRLAQGFVAAAFVPISLVYAGEILPTKKRVTAIGFILSGLLMSSIIGQVFSGFIYQITGLHAIYFVLGAIYLFTAILVVFYLPKEPTQHSQESLRERFIMMKDVLIRKQVLLCFSISFMLLFSIVGVYTLLGNYLSSAPFGLSTEHILLIRAAGIFGMLLAPFTGKISELLGTFVVLRGGLIIASISLFILSMSDTITVITLMSIIFVAGIALVMPVIITTLSLFVPNAKGSAISFNAFILFLGVSAGPILANTLINMNLNHFAFIVFAGILFIGVLLSSLITMKAAVPRKDMSKAVNE